MAARPSSGSSPPSAGLPVTVPEWFAHFNSSHSFVENLWEADHALTVRISTVAPHDENARLADALDAALGDRLYLHTITVPATGISILEVFDAHVNKWTGVRKVAAFLKIDPRSVVAIGDDMNDLPMLREAAVGVAMGNAKPAVKEAADLTIAANNADGVAMYLEALVAGQGAMTIAREPAKV